VRSILDIARDGRPLDDLDREHADEFLRDLIPPGVSQLFFFDGEKIQELADGEHDHIALADAVRGLIGLEHVERLRGDLRIYAGRLEDQPTAGPLRDELTKLSGEREALTTRRIELVRERDQDVSARDHILQEIRREEQRLTQSGGIFASKREKLVIERNQLTEAISQTEAEVRTLAEGLLPFMLAGNLCGDLRAQLSADRDMTRWLASETALRERVGQIKADIRASLFPRGDPTNPPTATRDAIVKRVKELLDTIAAPPKNIPEGEVLHHVTDKDRDRLLAAVGVVLDTLPEQMAGVSQRLERATRRLGKVEDALGKIPDEDSIQPILERLQELNRQHGAAEVTLSRSEAAVRELDLRLEDVGRRHRRTEEKLAEVNTTGERGALVGRVQTALEEFATRLTRVKVTELREAVLHSFTRLWRKGDLVRRIDFNPGDMQVTLFDQHDRPVPKERLSAGEKQIYAIALLWALAQVSGRPLPVVIDTPLGRLDRDHRSHLVNRYFPHASHQVVILSTDTEVDQAYFRELSPAVSHAYHLRYEAAEARCVVEEGYFWSTAGKEAASAVE
jgi:DNA sulfur modification protein DndD